MNQPLRIVKNRFIKQWIYDIVAAKGYFLKVAHQKALWAVHITAGHLRDLKHHTEETLALFFAKFDDNGNPFFPIRFTDRYTLVGLERSEPR